MGEKDPTRVLATHSPDCYTIFQHKTAISQEQSMLCIIYITHHLAAEGNMKNHTRTKNRPQIFTQQTISIILNVW